MSHHEMNKYLEKESKQEIEIETQKRNPIDTIDSKVPNKKENAESCDISEGKKSNRCLGCFKGISLINFKSGMNVKSCEEEASMSYKIKSCYAPLLFLLVLIFMIIALYLSLKNIG